MTKDKIIQKQKELIEHLMMGAMPARNDFEVNTWKVQYDELKKELTALESQDEVSDEAIEEVAKQVGFDQLDVELTNYELMQYKIGYVDGARAMRDGKITNQ